MKAIIITILGMWFAVRACVSGITEYGNWICGFRNCVVVQDNSWTHEFNSKDYGTIRLEKNNETINN